MPHVQKSDKQYVSFLMKRMLVARADQAAEEDGVSRTDLVSSVLETYLNHRKVELSQERLEKVKNDIHLTEYARKHKLVVKGSRVKNETRNTTR